jgi:hypothetical protein
MESKLFEKVLREATYSWEIDPLDRSWFISQSGKILADMSHRLILKKQFKEDWQSLKNRGEEDEDIERTLENRLIKSGTIKIGELDDFYFITNVLDNRTKDIIQGFAKSIKKVRQDISNKVCVILVNNEVSKYMMQDLIDDALFEVK